MSLKTCLLSFSFFLPVLLMGQNQRLEGEVTSASEGPLEMANVLVLSATDSSVVTYAFTNEDGRFRVSLAEGGNYILQVTYLGYKTSEQLVSIKEGEAPAFQSIRMTPEKESLDEVEVVEEMPIVISGDTISYKADAFTTGEERKLEDVLKELPGFEVGDDGQVKVQGKDVEKVMVEGKDFFDGDTKLATKNIPAKAVDKVQVLRNYNDVSPLNRVASSEDRIALNIKLKEGKKNMFFGDVTAEGGPEERYYLHPNLFYYSPKSSFNLIADANNVGRQAFTMQDYFRFNGGFRSLASRSGSVMQFNMGDIPVINSTGNRATEEISEFGALNFSYNPNKAWSLSGFVIANHSKVNAKSVMLRNYVGLDTIGFSENLTTTGLSDEKGLMGKLSVRYAPSPRLQVSYDAIAKASESDNIQERLSQFGPVENRLSSTNAQNPRSLKQNLGIYFDRSESSLISFEAQHDYQKNLPVFLLRTSQRPMFDLIPLMTDSNFYQLRQNRFLTSQKLDAVMNYYYIINGKNHIDFSLGGSYTGQKLESDMMQEIDDRLEVKFTSEDLVNDVDFNLSDLYTGAHYKSKIDKLEIRPGVNFHYYHSLDVQRGRSLQRDWFFVLPDFFAKYEFKKSESITLNYDMQAQFMDVSQVALGAVLTGYNSLSAGNRFLDNSLFHQLRLGYYSVNMFNFTNIFAGASYSRKIHDITNTVTYRGLDRVNRPINSPGANDVLNGYGRIQKRFWKLKASLGTNLMYSRLNNLVNDRQNTNTSFTQSYNAGLGTHFKDAPNIELGYKLSVNTYQGAQVKNTYVRSAPTVEVEASFLKGFSFEADYEYNFYKSKTGGTSSEYDFLNASLYYQKKDSPWEFKAGVTNLLNTEYIREDSFSDFLIATSQVYVLPRYWLFGVKYDL